MKKIDFELWMAYDYWYTRFVFGFIISEVKHIMIVDYGWYMK